MTGSDLKSLRKRFTRRHRFINRELSWLDFNERVLDEARDPAVPVLERLKFLAIVASNLDEFFMVRVALVRRQIEAGLDTSGSEGLRPSQIMNRIVRRVHLMHENIGDCFRNQIIPALARNNIHLITDTDLAGSRGADARSYFASTIRPLLEPVLIDEQPFPELENGALYFCLELSTGNGRKRDLAILRLPTNPLGRFVRLPPTDGRTDVIMIDDIVRSCLPDLFPGKKVRGCYEIKIVRDSDLELDEVGSEDLLNSILEGLQRRKRGPATRLLYDPATPPRILRYLEAQLNLKKRHSFVGARAHSFSDFMQVPSVVDRPDLLYPPMPPLPVTVFEQDRPFFQMIRDGDILLQHPFQSFSPVIRFFENAADDPHVTEISTTLYRVSSDSAIAKALARAASGGKKVRVLIELKARFDEERNIGWARSLQSAGAEVVYGVKGLKTHCKLALVVREEKDGRRLYSHLSTGNYNDRTARIYSDFGLLTANETICHEVAAVLEMVLGGGAVGTFGSLLVAPSAMRKEFVRRIHREAAHARKGRRSGIIAKMNSLVDTNMIDELYAASRAGVKIDLIVRGICCLRPGIPGLSETIKVTSIIDRFLEHARVYRFENDGDPELFLASADWMPRNLNSRVETAFPVLDTRVRAEIDRVLQMQLADSVKGRLLRPDGTSERRKASAKEGSAQLRQYEHIRSAAEGLLPQAHIRNPDNFECC
ncbi:MAG: polyphosphate kinase 1 [Ignavibacteria bacterium]|nr:polyphosphate kinase 1 [Ignavibacteria bacterium]